MFVRDDPAMSPIEMVMIDEQACALAGLRNVSGLKRLWPG
jgi:hypothetical protein